MRAVSETWSQRLSLVPLVVVTNATRRIGTFRRSLHKARTKGDATESAGAVHLRRL